MLLSANEVSAELLTGRGGGDDAAPPSPPSLSQQPSAPLLSLPPLGEVIIMMLMLLIPSHSCFLVSVCGALSLAKGVALLPPPSSLPHTCTHHFFSSFLKQH